VGAAGLWMWFLEAPILVGVYRNGPGQAAAPPPGCVSFLLLPVSVAALLLGTRAGVTLAAVLSGAVGGYCALLGAMSPWEQAKPFIGLAVLTLAAFLRCLFRLSGVPK
jgi:hypothetical protein